MLGVTGYVCATGIGTLTRSFWASGQFDRLLAVEHPTLGMGDFDVGQVGGPVVHQKVCPEPAKKFLHSVQAVLATERTIPDRMFQWGRAAGVRCCLLAMAEWITPTSPWMKAATLIMAPTQQCADRLHEAGLADRTVRLECPLHPARLPFRERGVCQRVGFANGFGGCNDRKGVVEMAACLALRPHLPITVRSQVNITSLFLSAIKRPHSFRIVEGTVPEEELFNEVDLMVQPSRYEGLGLQILESFAAGVPVLTTDAPPMADFIRRAYGADADQMLVKVASVKKVRTWSGDWPAHCADPDDMGRKIEGLLGKDLTAFSRAGRTYIEKHHGMAAMQDMAQLVKG